MTEELFRSDSYLRECDATVVAVGENAFSVDRTVFYPLGGGQPGDTGTVSWAGGITRVVDTRYGEGGSIEHLVGAGEGMPGVGDSVTLSLDWDRRYRHMRMHTLDFDMEDTVDKVAVQEALQGLVAADHPVSFRWISDEELDANPDLVRTMSVQPPRGKGKVRLLEIEGVDLQPCGGTHLKSTAEVGQVRIGKVEKKGKRNRRVNIHLDG
jgi:misacylated tRNA(Ala) deacylase